jgi:hypothetical protein
MLLAIIPSMFNFALLGPVPPGGTGKLPGIVLLVIGVVGIFSLPSQIKKMKAATQSRFRLFVVVGLDVAFLVAGLLLMRNG